MNKKKRNTKINRQNKEVVGDDKKTIKRDKISRCISDISGIVTIIGLIAIPKQIIESYLLKGMHSYLGLENLLFTIKWNFLEFWNQNIISIVFVLFLIGLSYLVNIQWQKYKSQYDKKIKCGVIVVVFVVFLLSFMIMLYLLGHFNILMSFIFAGDITLILFVFVISEFIVSLFERKESKNDKNRNKSSKQRWFFSPIVTSITVPIIIGCAIIIILSLCLYATQNSFIEQGKDILKSNNNYSFIDKGEDKYVLFETTNNEKIIIQVTEDKPDSESKTQNKKYKIKEKGVYQNLTEYDVKVTIENCIIEGFDDENK